MMRDGLESCEGVQSEAGGGQGAGEADVMFARSGHVARNRSAFYLTCGNCINENLIS